MGRTSKFSFPYPGRKHFLKEKELKVTAPAYTHSGHNTSKAQKILGTAGDLNIDSPIREIDDSISWRSFGAPSSSGMSFAISESTQQDDSSYESNNSNWDEELLDEQLQTKASSTVLGGRYQEDVSTDTSSIRRQLHTEHSISTIRSYYDRQTSPPLVSQQTSASSARDLALRKGLPPITSYPHSPLLQEEFWDGEESYCETPQTPTSTISQSSKKKPARLDLTRLFPKPRRDGDSILGKEVVTRSPSVYSQESSSTRRSNYGGLRKLKKSDSRTKKSRKPAKQLEQAQTSSSRKLRKDRVSNVYEDRESFSRSPPIPERKSSRQYLQEAIHRTVCDDHHHAIPQSRDVEAQRSTDSEDQFSWANIRASLAASPWETRSVASNDSLNTKGSKHTSTSIMSNSDLQNQSVLSISSGSDSDENINAIEPRSPQQNTLGPSNQPERKTSRGSRVANDRPVVNANTKASVPTRPHGMQDSNFLTIPPPRLAGSRLSGPWNPKPNKKSTTSRYDSESIASGGSGKSKNSKGSKSKGKRKKSPERDSRLMTVTKQEEALLEALRLKKARMKEAIIAEHEHEIKKSPSREPHTRHAARDSNCSELTIRAGNRNDTQRVLLYLDAPVSFPPGVDAAEPSPDLSDFLSFGSDEDDDSTPRTSWIVDKDRARADSVTSPESETRDSPKTPQSAARLSAVGAPGAIDGRKSVAFLESVKSESPDFLDELDGVWGA